LNQLLFEPLDQSVEIVVERGMADLESVAQGKLLKSLGQLIWFWNAGTVQQNWDHGYVAL
jgi:hypothetical protein